MINGFNLCCREFVDRTGSSCIDRSFQLEKQRLSSKTMRFRQSHRGGGAQSPRRSGGDGHSTSLSVLVQSVKLFYRSFVEAKTNFTRLYDRRMCERHSQQLLGIRHWMKVVASLQVELIWVRAAIGFTFYICSCRRMSVNTNKLHVDGLNYECAKKPLTKTTYARIRVDFWRDRRMKFNKWFLVSD